MKFLTGNFINHKSHSVNRIVQSIGRVEIGWLLAASVYVPFDLSNYYCNAHLMLLLVCRWYIPYQSDNLAFCDKDSKQSVSHGSSAAHLISVFLMSFADSPQFILSLYNSHSTVTFMLFYALSSARQNSTMHTSPTTLNCISKYCHSLCC